VGSIIVLAIAYMTHSCHAQCDATHIYRAKA